MWVRNNKGNVFVGNLPPDFPDERLAEAFDPFGIVLTAAVARDPSTGARLRYGFVDIATERAATQAIAALDGSEIDGCKLNVKARERAKKAPPGARPRRPASRTAPPNGVPYAAAAPRPVSPPAAGTPARLSISQLSQSHPAQSHPAQSHPAQSQPAQSHPAQSHPAQSQSAQSQLAREGLPEIEPPRRTDFEIVRRPIRRGTPNFQVERRPLPRRV